MKLLFFYKAGAFYCAYARRRSALTAPHYAKVSNLVKKGKVFAQAFFKRLVRVKGRKPIVAVRRRRNSHTTCAPLLEVRGEKLEVRNVF